MTLHLPSFFAGVVLCYLGIRFLARAAIAQQQQAAVDNLAQSMYDAQHPN